MRIAIVGLGRMGRRHVQVAEQLGLTIVGICDRSPEAISAAGAEHGIAESARFTDFAALLRQARPEAVVVATHAPSHCEFVCQAADAGVRNILCEKPMAVSLAECDRMIAVCGGLGARLAVNHQMRFMPQYTEARRIVHSPEFGGLASVTVVAGNIGLAMNGTHYFELFRYLTGERPAEVTAWFSPQKVANPRGPQFEDRGGAIRVTSPTGTRLYLEAGADQGHGIQVIYSGPFGQLTADELAGTLRLSVRQTEYRQLPSTRYGAPSIESNVHVPPSDAVAPTAAVLSALLAGEDFPSGADGRQAVAVLVAGYLSHESGHRPLPLSAAEEAVERVFPWA